jgi:hypothetical protein
MWAILFMRIVRDNQAALFSKDMEQPVKNIWVRTFDGHGVAYALLDGRSLNFHPLIGPSPQQRIQGLDGHPSDAVAMFIGILLGSFDQPARDIDDNGLGIIITIARFRFVGQRGILPVAMLI